MKNVFATAEAFTLAALTALVKVGKDAEALFLGKVDLGNGHSATIMIPAETAAAFALVTETEVEDDHKYPAVDSVLADAEAFAREEFKTPGHVEVKANGVEAEHAEAEIKTAGMDLGAEAAAEKAAFETGEEMARAGLPRSEMDGPGADGSRRGFDSVMAEFHKGADLAKAGEALPEDANADVRRGFESVIQEKGNAAAAEGSGAAAKVEEGAGSQG